MAELITGDTTKGIKSVGELALRISKFDSYRLFTLYENVRERKVMDVSGNQRYYLVFKSPKKEIRIPEYEPNGFFEVDKTNGCILFKITKKNAEDILGMKTGGEKIFHIIRTFEERDAFGKVLNVTDEVEVYHGRWGDDLAFSTFTTENKVDLLTKSLAVQMDKNATQLNEYRDLLERYNSEVSKTSDLEKELEAMRAERDSLQTLVNEYTGSTYDGTLLSTDTKYIAFENTLDNISFTEEEFSNAMNELMSKSDVNYDDGDDEVVNNNIYPDDPYILIDVSVGSNTGPKITLYRNGVSIKYASYNNDIKNEKIFINEGDVIEFRYQGPTNNKKNMTLDYSFGANGFNGAVKMDKSSVSIANNVSIKGTISVVNKPMGGSVVYVGGDMGKLTCTIE